MAQLNVQGVEIWLDYVGSECVGNPQKLPYICLNHTKKNTLHEQTKIQ